MALKFFGGEFVTGLSSDTKPDIAAGARFLETDTGVIFRYDGTDWTQIRITKKITFVLESPVATDLGLLQHKVGLPITIRRVSASTDQGTCTFQLDERAEGTPNSSGTDILTAPLVADTDTESTTAFDNAEIADNALISLDIDAVTGSPGVVRIHIEYD